MVFLLVLQLAVTATAPECTFQGEKLELSTGLSQVYYGVEKCPGQSVRDVVRVSGDTHPCAFVDLNVVGVATMYLVCTDKVLKVVSGAVSQVQLPVDVPWRIFRHRVVPSVGVYPLVGTRGRLVGILRLAGSDWGVDSTTYCLVSRVDYRARMVVCSGGAVVPFPRQ